MRRVEKTYEKMNKLQMVNLLLLIALIFILPFAWLSSYGSGSKKINKPAHGPRLSTLSLGGTEVFPQSDEDFWEEFIEEDGSVESAETFVPANSYDFGVSADDSLVYMSQEELDAYFSKMQDLGVTWFRFDLAWRTVQEKNSRTFDWSGSDRVVRTAKRFGIEPLALLAYAPDWASENNCTADVCPPSDSSAKFFANFAAATAKRYKGNIDHFEIWNEPNFAGFWSPAADVQDYSELLRLSYLGIKKSNPSATVILGGLAAADDDQSGNISPLTFVRSIYAIKANRYFDGIAIHPYTYPVLADSDASWSCWQHMLQIREIMKENGDGDKKIWITEYGVPTSGPGVEHQAGDLDFTYNYDYMSEKSQSDMAITAVFLYEENKSWLGGFFWYSLFDKGTDKETPENFFGLLGFNGEEKSAYDHIKGFLSSDK